MKKNVRILNIHLLVCMAIVSLMVLQASPKVHAQSQFMDYFTSTPIIGSLSSTCWGAAAVGPRDQSNGLESRNNSYCYWDGGIIKGSDGVYHMFASRWDESAGHMGWFGSVAVHATSNNLYGPYTDRGLCWPNNQNGKGHNVFPFIGGDGNYYIIVSDTRPGDIFRATSLEGPWSQVGTLSYSGNFGQTANICVMYRPDGRYMAVPRSGVIGISNNNVLGTYVVQGTSAYVQAGVPSGNLEDPVVWYSGGKYHIVVNKWDTRKAYHITSTDGINGWTLSPGLAYDPTANFIRYTNGTVNHWNKLERFNVYIEDGYVTAVLLSGIDVAKDADGGNDQHGSKVLVVPFDGVGLDGGEPPTPTPTPGPTPMPQQEPVWSGGPYTLNGTSDYVDLPDGLTNNLNNFSIACRVNLNSLDNWTRIFDFGGDTNIFMMLTPASGTTGYPYFCITLTGNDGEQGLNGISTLPTGSWQHFAITKSENTAILYINGQEVDRNTAMTLNPADMGNTLNNYIGRSQWEHDPYLNGQVDDFFVYNRAISPSEVAALVDPTEITPEPTNESTQTPTPTPTGDCNVFFNPANSTQNLNSEFHIDVVVNSGNQELAAYGFNITYDAALLHVVDVEAGADGFLAAANTTNPGEIMASGFDSSGTGPGSDLQVLIITFNAIAEGTSTLGLSVDKLVDGGTATIGSACGTDGMVEVSDTGLQGDADGNGNIDIVDALLIAQYYVDLDPANFIPENADVDCNGSIDIVDALLVAQYYVELISEFC